MTEELARLIFIVVMAAGFGVWLWSLQKTLAIGKRQTQPDWRALPEQQPDPGSTVSGSRIVRGAPEMLSQALARSLTQVGIGGFIPLFEITERSSYRIALKKVGPLMCNQPAGIYFSEAEITLNEVGIDSTRVSYQLGFDRLVRRVRTVSLAIILGIGLPLMVIVGSVVWFTVIPSAQPAVRWQVLQTLQIVHGLWPPFLVLGLYSMGRRHAKTYVSNLLTTLESSEQLVESRER